MAAVSCLLGLMALELEGMQKRSGGGVAVVYITHRMDGLRKRA